MLLEQQNLKKTGGYEIAVKTFLMLHVKSGIINY